MQKLGYDCADHKTITVGFDQFDITDVALQAQFMTKRINVCKCGWVMSEAKSSTRLPKQMLFDDNVLVKYCFDNKMVTGK